MFRKNKLTSLNLAGIEIESVDVSFNRIRDLQSSGKVMFLKAAWNNISSIDAVDFSSTELLDLSSNSFSCFPELQLENSPQLLLLHGNPIDCGIENLNSFFGFTPARKSLNRLEFICQTPAALAGRSLSSLTLKEIDLEASSNMTTKKSDQQFCRFVKMSRSNYQRV